LKVLVTGANGFLGKWVCAELLARGHRVGGGVKSLNEVVDLPPSWRERLAGVRWVSLDLAHGDEVEAALRPGHDAIIHLAAVASGMEARAHPLAAWEINCLGTCAMLYGMERLGLQARFILASTGEVYGPGLSRAAREGDPVAPCSPYGASKAAAELALQEYCRRTDGDGLVARLFPFTGPGQQENYVVPALARRIRSAQQSGRAEIPVGNLAPVRELLDVRDVAPALGVLLERGERGGVYNVARGEGLALEAVFTALAEIVGWSGTPVPEPGLFRRGDIPYLVGEGTRMAALGWAPEHRWRTTLSDLVASL
jgi:GDP-4-dehydro-6-deoxy-D-mannose reductase